ncbi:putative transcription factor AS2-LOB family [Dioscorea sansibarensis]
MESNETMTTFYTPSSSSSPSPATSPPPPPVVQSPCAACKILRRRCADKCILAPYFPPTDPLSSPPLTELPEYQRADAVTSMVYEAKARIRDPVYGCAGVICHLQREVSDLQTQLAKAQAEIISMQSQQANLIALVCMEMDKHKQPSLHNSMNLDHQSFDDDPYCFLDDISLWT